MGAANENDRDGVKLALINMNSKYTNVTKMWADMGYVSSELKAYIKENYNINLEIEKDRHVGSGYIRIHHQNSYRSGRLALK